VTVIGPAAFANVQTETIDSAAAQINRRMLSFPDELVAQHATAIGPVGQMNITLALA
jgi:hypothetical protein